MKRKTLILLTGILFFVPLSFAQSAADWMKQATSALEQSMAGKGIVFNIEASGDINYDKARIEILKEKFTFSSEPLNFWYDGKSLWTYQKESNEVTITEPSTEELQTFNPYLLLKNYGKYYSVQLLSNKGNIVELSLTPKEKGGTAFPLRLSIEKTSKQLKSIVITPSTDTKIVTKIVSQKGGINIPAESFVLNKKLYPQAVWVDMR